MLKIGYLPHIIDTVNDRIGRVASFLIVATTLILCFEVAMRYIFNVPTIWVHETTQFVYGAFFLLAGGYCLLYGLHVNVDIIYSHFPTRIKALVDLSTYLLFFLFCYVLLWEGGKMARDSILMLEHSHSFWAPPVWPIKLMVPIAAFLLTLQGLASFIRRLITAATGKEQYEHRA